MKFSLVLKSAAQIKLLFIQINRPDLFIVFIAIESVLFIIKIILAIGLLRGKNLARWLWLSFGLVYFVILLIALPSDFHGPISDTRFLGDIFKLLWIISLFILFKSDVTEYFYSASSVRRKNISE